jgi:hypothetical protein
MKVVGAYGVGDCGFGRVSIAVQGVDRCGIGRGGFGNQLGSDWGIVETVTVA